MNVVNTSAASLNNLVTVIAAIGSVISGYIGMTVWKDKGGNPGGGFLLGGLLGPLGVFILVVAKPRQKEIDRVARRQGLVPCPSCAEIIKGQACVCHYCGRDVAPAPGGAT
jgi:hypothetical protein